MEAQNTILQINFLSRTGWDGDVNGEVIGGGTESAHDNKKDKIQLPTNSTTDSTIRWTENAKDKNYLKDYW